MEQELQIATTAAREAGAAIARIFHTQDFTVTQKSQDRGPLTEADLLANNILTEHLTRAFPNDGLMSEETLDDPSRLKKSRVWIIDPLDGTREFTLGIPEFVVSIGLVVDGEAKLGVLYNPIREELFAGVVGKGCTLNGVQVHATSHSAVQGGRFLVSRSEHKKGWFQPWEQEAEMTPMGSVAYKLGLVAAGKAEATFTPKPRNEWDLCGGVACILAAGGLASDGSGTPYRFNRPDPLHIGVCGTNGALHPQVLKMMTKAGS
jgi:myo-inositol-1(or 4)-monophosphatase